MSDVKFIRAYVVHRRRHPEFLATCDVCTRAKAFLDAASSPPELLDISFIKEPNDFGRGKSGKAWKREMRLQLCHYCGKEGGTIDHRVPVYRGGADRQDNCVPSCFPCNTLKGGLTEEEFVRYRKTGILPA
jgi:5-methylcytosine-specific restriction endonuclease McrA